MSEASRYKKIAVPVDGSNWSQRAVPHAVDLASSNNADLYLIHVFRPPAQEYADVIALAGAQDQVDEKRNEVKQYLMGLRGELRGQGVNAFVHMVEGPAVAHLICDYVNAEGFDLVVMTTHGRTGVGRFLFGSIASKVMAGVNVPVLLVRPDQD